MCILVAQRLFSLAETRCCNRFGSGTPGAFHRTDRRNARYAYSISGGTGALAPVAGSPFASGTYPFYVAVEPEDEFVYVTNSGSANVYAYVISVTSGALAPVAGSPFPAGTNPTGLATCRVKHGTCKPPPL